MDEIGIEIDKEVRIHHPTLPPPLLPTDDRTRAPTGPHLHLGRTGDVDSVPHVAQGRPLPQARQTRPTPRLPRAPRILHQRRASEPQARAHPRTGGSQEDPECPVGDWTVPRAD